MIAGEPKPELALLPWPELADLARVIAHGNEKYPDREPGIVPRIKHLSAALRHIAKRCSGVVYDAESGLPHLAHAVCRILFAMRADSVEEVAYKLRGENAPDHRNV